MVQLVSGLSWAEFTGPPWRLRPELSGQGGAHNPLGGPLTWGLSYFQSQEIQLSEGPRDETEDTQARAETPATWSSVFSKLERPRGRGRKWQGSPATPGTRERPHLLPAEQWRSSGANLAPRGCLVMFGDSFGYHSWGRCYWHLVGRDQGCCSTPYSARDSPHLTKNEVAPNVTSAMVRTPVLES